MESIREVFKDKGFSEEELSYLENAINEFGEVFGDFVSREDLIERARNTIDKIEFTERLDSTTTCAIGCYVLKDKKIQVLKGGLEAEEIKSVFFHEFLHAIVSDGKNTGFMRKYQIIDVDREDSLVYLGRGWNEGFVQMMTQERDKKVTNKVISEFYYPILTESVTKFTNLLGRNELIDLYFNHADRFAKFMYEKVDSLGEIFLMDFDVIHKHERKIFAKKMGPQDNIGRLFSAIFGEEKRDINNEKLKSAQEEIMQVYMNALLEGRIESPTELQDTLNNIIEMYKVFSKTISVYTIQRIIEQSNPDILSSLEELDWKSQVLLDKGIKFESFEKSDVSKKIKILMDKEFIDSFWGLYEEYPSLMKEYFSSIMTELYSGCGEFQNKDLSWWLLHFRGVAQYIDENNLSFENLKIVYNEYRYSGAVFELYNLQESGEYEKVSTLVVDTNSENLDTKKYTKVEIERLAELRERISKEYSIEIDQAFEDENGNYVVYDENGQVFVSTEFNEIERPCETMSFESVNEIKLKHLEQRIVDRMARLERYQEMQAPDIIIQRESKMLEENISEKSRVHESIRSASRKNITLSQIETKTINENVTVQSLQKAIEDLLTEDKNLENEGEDLNVE